MDDALCGHAAYGPYILSGNGPARRGRLQAFACTRGYHALLVEDGILSANRPLDGLRRWDGPCGLVVEPTPDLRITASAGSRVAWLLFHVIHGDARPRRTGPGRYHADEAPPQPDSRAVWGIALPSRVPQQALPGMRAMMAMACSGWWRGPLGLARAGHLLGAWLHDHLETAEPDGAGGVDLERLESLARAALRQELGLRGIAAACGLGPDALATRVRAATDRSLAEWIADLRLREVCRLLRTTVMPVSEVGRLCGWRSPSSFSRAFQGAFGVPPATWRRNAATLPLADTTTAGPHRGR